MACVATGLAIGALTMAVTSQPSFAADPCKLVVTPPSSTPGNWVMLHGWGLEPGKTAQGYLASQQVASDKTPSSGEILLYFKVPDGLTSGQYPVFITTGAVNCSALFTLE